MNISDFSSAPVQILSLRQTFTRQEPRGVEARSVEGAARTFHAGYRSANTLFDCLGGDTRRSHHR
jgi:hypothetical protein